MSESLTRRLPISFLSASGSPLSIFSFYPGSVDNEVLDMITMVSRSFAGVGGSLVLVFAFLPAFIVPTIFLGEHKHTIMLLSLLRELTSILSTSQVSSTTDSRSPTSDAVETCRGSRCVPQLLEVSSRLER